MVLLTMTQSIVDGLNKLLDAQSPDAGTAEPAPGNVIAGEPSTADPAVGRPISHAQIVQLWKSLAASDASPACSLEQLLQGSRVYIPPPPPKPEPSEEYKALMARLRREEDERAYERMLNPPSALDASTDHLASAAHAFAEVNRPSNAADLGDDEVTMNEVHRQVTLIINFLISIAGVAATLWVAGQWWSVPARLFLTMGGSLLVAIAEVAVYSGYMWRLDQGKQKQVAVKEVKQVVKTWVVGQDGTHSSGEQEQKILPKDGTQENNEGALRKRHAAKEESVNEE